MKFSCPVFAAHDICFRLPAVFLTTADGEAVAQRLPQSSGFNFWLQFHIAEGKLSLRPENYGKAFEAISHSYIRWSLSLAREKMKSFSPFEQISMLLSYFLIICNTVCGNTYSRLFNQIIEGIESLVYVPFAVGTFRFDCSFKFFCNADQCVSNALFLCDRERCFSFLLLL